MLRAESHVFALIMLFLCVILYTMWSDKKLQMLCACLACCLCCQPTPPCLFGGVLSYFEVTGHPVTVSSLGFKCPDCFIWNCS